MAIDIVIVGAIPRVAAPKDTIAADAKNVVWLLEEKKDFFSLELNIPQPDNKIRAKIVLIIIVFKNFNINI